MKKFKLATILTCILASMVLISCGDKKDDISKEDNTKPGISQDSSDNTNSDEKDNEDKDDTTENDTSKDDKDKDNDDNKDDDNDNNKDDDKNQATINYDKYYNGTNKLSLDIPNKGIADMFCDYELKKLSSDELQVTTSSLRGSFKGTLKKSNNSYTGTLKSITDSESYKVEAFITDHAIKIIETENNTDKTTTFYLKSQTYEVKTGDKSLEKSSFKLTPLN
ncbi:MAG: hypothetical protein ACRC41_07580 [Sarcina sp.]